MKQSEFIAAVESLHADAQRRGLFFQTCEDPRVLGRQVTLRGKQLLSFASCSYLGLEVHKGVIEGVQDAVARYGAQFSTSRGFLSVPLYEELEETLGRIFGAHALVAQTTSLAHQAAFEVLLNESDAIVLDHQVHASVHRAATLARAGGTRVDVVKHEHLERTLDLVKELAPKHRTVWFATDGVASMYGDLAPMDLILELLDVAPNVRIYIDDAHGMSWVGRHGRGSFLSRLEETKGYEQVIDRVVVATSMAKGFGAGGGILVFRDPADKERVRMCGGPMTFSGPIQPPMLGACLGSARIHLTDEIDERQRVLAELVGYTKRACVDAGLPLLVANEVPIVFIRCGLPRVSAEVVSRLADDGIYVNVSMYPTVPMRRSGVRLSITSMHSHAEIDRAIASLARHLPAVLAEENISRDELDQLFEKTVVGPRRFDAEKPAAKPARHKSGPRMSAPMRVDHHRTIDDVDPTEWNALLGTAGCISWDAQKTAERIFSQDAEKPEHRWKFDYVIVREPTGRPLAATVLTTLLQKDDMLAQPDVSREIEVRRQSDPYLLTSRVVMSGSGLSEGNHIFLEREGRWAGALRQLVDIAAQIQIDAGATALILRDLPDGDRDLEDEMREDGLVRVPGLATHRVAIDWSDDEDLLARLPARRYRKASRRSVETASQFSVARVDAGATDEQLARLHEMYRSVAQKKLRLNTFEFPTHMLRELVRSHAWEVVEMRLDPAFGGPSDGSPVAFWAAHHHGGHYTPLFCGLDYEYVATHGTYKQMIFQVLRRAKALGGVSVHLGMDADLEKRRWGSVEHPTCMYLQASDHYNAVLLREIVAEVAVGRVRRAV